MVSHVGCGKRMSWQGRMIAVQPYWFSAVYEENIVVAKTKTDPEREHRISMEIIVDAYNEYEQALGWYYYLKDNLEFPFTATCVCKRVISPLQVKDEIEVLGMAPEDECEHEIFVNIRWDRDGLAVPLSQLRPSDADPETMQAVEDWHYWIGKGYRF